MGQLTTKEVFYLKQQVNEALEPSLEPLKALDPTEKQISQLDKKQDELST